MSEKLVTILGPTAVGKTKIAVQLAHQFRGEIISADSRQVYKFMDIGTGKDLNEYQINGTQTPYHLINVIDPHDEFDLYKFRALFAKSYREIVDRDNLPFLVGGTGLFLHSVLKNYSMPLVSFDVPRFDELMKLEKRQLKSILLELNPALHNSTDLTDKNRIIRAIIIAENKPNSEPLTFESDFNKSLVIGVTLPMESLHKNIKLRLQKRLEEGMIDEVKTLIEIGVGIEKLKFFGLEYKFIAMYLNKEINYNDMFQKLNSAIRNFAKRQMTWFRKMEREGIVINWISAIETEAGANLVSNYLVRS